MARHSILLFQLISFLSLIGPTLVAADFNADKNCSISPFAVGFGNVTVNDNPLVKSDHRGVEVLVGSSRSRLALNIATTLNITIVSDGPKICNLSRPDALQCVGWRGGLYSTSDSTSWKLEDNTIPFNGSAENPGYDAVNGEEYQGLDEDPFSPFPRGWDTFSFPAGDKNVDMPSYPFTTINNATFPFGQGMLGLASDSRFLDIGVATNKTPTHAWGLDYGTTGVYAAGELVFGGYNRAKADMTQAQNFSIFADKSIPCPLQIAIESVNLSSTEAPLNTKSFTACVEPAYWTLIMPLEVQRNFNASVLKTQADIRFKNQTWEYMYFLSNSSNIPFPSMNITLAGGFSVAIPANELFFRETNLRPQGGWDFVDGGYQATMGTAAYTDRDPIVYLGAPFLSQLYLGVDYESGTFFLAPIKRDSSDTDLVTLGCPATASGSKSSSNTGAIVGGVVGGVLGLALIGAGAFFFLRRRKPTVMPDPVGVGEGYKAKYEGQGELPPAYQTPQVGGEIFEAPVQRQSVFVELPGEHFEGVQSPVQRVQSPVERVQSPVSEMDGFVEHRVDGYTDERQGVVSPLGSPNLRV